MDVFTTGQVAKICMVAPRTVVKWFDSGRLRGWRVPGSPDRRIPREYLVTFLKDNGMPLGALATKGKILIVSFDSDLESGIKNYLPGTQVNRVVDVFEAGHLMQSPVPTAIVIDAGVGMAMVSGVWQGIQKHSKLVSVPVVLLAEKERVISEELAAAAEIFYHPFDVKLLATRLQTLIKTVAL